jgi:tetratricopeptide (TPR) repeat protein
LNLIDTKTQNLVRSEKLDYSKEKNLIIQDEVISVMVTMLGLELEAETKEHITLGGSTLYSANELYLKGRGILREGVATQEDIDGALDHFLSAIDKDSLFALAYAGVAQAYTYQYHFTLDPVWNDESLKYSRKAVELNDQDAYALMSLAASLVEKGAYDEALLYYEKSRDIDSTRANIYSELAYLYEMKGEMWKAEQHHKKAIELDPDSHLSHYYLGGFYYYQVRYEEATGEFEKALELSPGHLTIMHALGACYYELEHFNDAIHMFEEVLEKDSAQGQVLLNLGNIYYYQEDFEKSIIYYQKALRYTPKNYSLHSALGKAYLWSDHRSLADESFQNAIDIGHQDMSCSDIHFATWFGLLGRLDSADFYLSSFDLPDNPETLEASAAYMIGELYLILERETLAFPYIESALKRGFGWRDVRYSPFFKALEDNEDFQEMLVLSEK